MRAGSGVWPRARAFVLATEVTIDAWQPEFEIEHRRIVPASEAVRYVRDPDDAATRIHCRALVEAGLVDLEP